MSDNQTLSPDDLTKISETPEGLRAVVFEPGGPLQSVPMALLLTKLIGTGLTQTTEAALGADLDHPENAVAMVHNDAAAGKNGWYRKIGASGAGSWSQFETLSISTKTAAEAAVQAAEASVAAAQAAIIPIIEILQIVLGQTEVEGVEDITFGALSRAQEGAGIAVAGASISSGDPSGHWQITGGMLYPTEVGAIAGMNAGPYLIVLNDGSKYLIGIQQNAWDVATADEFDAIAGLSAETLANKTIRIRGDQVTTQLILSNRDMHAEDGVLTLTSADENSSIPSIQFTGTTRGIDLSALNVQMTGWPSDYRACFVLGTGTFGKLRLLNGTSFRHGYGEGHTDFVTDADLPEYERIPNVLTATTTSTAHALTWKDATAPTGWIEFFNRGDDTVYAELGGSGVAATTSSQAIPAGSRRRMTKRDPDVDTHIAILAASGTQEVNARTEVGLSEYLCDTFQQTGSAVLEDIEIRGCKFRDLSNGIKGLRTTGYNIVMDNDLDRIYQDVIALAPEPGASVHVLRNLECLPFARSGIAEDLNGDARDPHGDQFQMFNNAPGGTVGPLYYAGNRIRLTPRRTGIQSQGIFVSDNDFDPSFTDLYFISTMQIGGAGRALSLGEESTSFKIRDAFVFGATVLNGHDFDTDFPFVLIDHDDDGTVYVGKTIATDFRVTGADWLEQDNFTLSDAADRAAVFPNFGDLAAASNRSEIELAIGTAAEGLGIGAAATASAIDWDTNDHTAVILWANLPSGAHWNPTGNQTPNTLVELPLRKIMNRHPSQAVAVGTGTQWRSVDTDRVTEVQAWTSNSGTIEPDQFIHIRRTSSAVGKGVVTASVTINGNQQSVAITTANVPTDYLVQGAVEGRFVDPSNVPSDTDRITFRAKLYLPGSIPNNAKPFTQSSTGCDLILQSDGSMNATTEDGGGIKMATNLEVAPAGTMSADRWHDIVFDVDHVAEEIRVTVDGETTTTPFDDTNTSNGVFQSNRAISFLAGATGATALPTGTRVADLSVDFNGAPHKAIANIPATANDDNWHAGGAFAGPT